jgi:hypothetical protein
VPERERADVTDDGRSAGAANGDGDDPERAALPEKLRLRGEVVAVERVPAGEVPDSFPVAIWTDEALALRLEFARHEGHARTYFSLPETDPDDRLATLLDVHDVDEPDDLADKSLLVDVVDGHPMPVSREGKQRGDDRAVYGVVAGVAPSITIALFSFFGLGDAVFSTVYIALYLVCTFLVLPVSVYFDAWHLRTTTDWEGRPLRWALIAIVPPLYVVVVPYYLITRENARPLALDPATVQ